MTFPFQKFYLTLIWKPFNPPHPAFFTIDTRSKTLKFLLHHDHRTWEMTLSVTLSGNSTHQPSTSPSRKGVLIIEPWVETVHTSLQPPLPAKVYLLNPEWKQYTPAFNLPYPQRCTYWTLSGNSTHHPSTFPSRKGVLIEPWVGTVHSNLQAPTSPSHKCVLLNPDWEPFNLPFPQNFYFWTLSENSTHQPCALPSRKSVLFEPWVGSVHQPLISRYRKCLSLSVSENRDGI